MTDTTTTNAQREWQGLTVPRPGTFKLDPAHSRLGFVATHMMFTKVRGEFTDFSGTVQVADDPTDTSVEVTVETASVNTNADDRDAHLRSGDFFDADNHPHISFRSTEIRHVGGTEFAVRGDLTIRGVTRPLELTATFEGAGTNPWGVEVAGVSARTEIDREEWDLTWNAALETGGVLVGKKVTLEIDIQAQRA